MWVPVLVLLSCVRRGEAIPGQRQKKRTQGSGESGGEHFGSTLCSADSKQYAN